MGRKYLEDAGIAFEFDLEGDSREKKWEEERKVYGFDERETWSLKESFKIWLFERLSRYNEVNIIDTSTHKFNYKEQEITFQDCIDRMLEGLRLDLTLSDQAERDLNKEKIEDVLPLFNLCFEYLWW